VLRLFEEFAARRARGERPDPVAYLERAGDGAGELRPMLDRLLAGEPGREPSPETLAMMSALAEGEPPLLGLRRHRRVRVDAMVDGLVAALGIDPAARAKVKDRYQRLEGGLLDPRRIDARLRDAIAAALGVAGGDLAIGGPPPAAAADMAFARAHDAAPAPLAAPSAAPEEPDEVDRLFGLA
jgi:hypothetical protein